MKKVKLVLSGSGTRFPVFVGAVKRLSEEGYEFEAVCGTSGGSIVAAGLSLGFGIDKITDICLDILPGLQRLLDPSLWTLFSKWGLLKGSKMESVLLDHTGRTKFGAAKIPLKVVTVNYDKANTIEPYNVFSTEKTPDVCIARAVRASMSIPFVFEPVLINGDRHVDGGVGSNFPIDIYGENATDVIGLNMFPNYNGPRRRAKSLAEYAFTIIDKFSSASLKEYVTETTCAKVINLETKHGGLNFFMTKAQVLDMMEEGYHSVDTWIRR
jgi:NTE family protein